MARRPPDRVEPTNPPESDVVPLGTEELTLQIQVAAEAPKSASSPDDPMAGGCLVPAFAEDAANGPVGAWRPGEAGDVPVRRHATRWNAPHRGKHAFRERG